MTPVTAPVPEPGEVGELVADLNEIAQILCGMEKHRWAAKLIFAATLLQQQAPPAAAPVAMIELITDMAMHLAHMQELLEDYEYGDPEDYHWYRESVRLRSLAREVLA